MPSEADQLAFIVIKRVPIQLSDNPGPWLLRGQIGGEGDILGSQSDWSRDQC